MVTAAAVRFKRGSYASGREAVDAFVDALEATTPDQRRFYEDVLVKRGWVR